MKIYLLSVLAFGLFISCKTDPNKQVDEGQVVENTYQSNEIGWTIEIPEGWNVKQREESQAFEDKGLKAINEPNGID